MFYKIQEWKNFLLGYLKSRRGELPLESKEFVDIEEAYKVGYLRGFWEGAGESYTQTQQ